MSDATTKWKNIRSVRRLVLWLCIGIIVFREIVRAAFKSIAMPEDHLFAYIGVFAWLTLLWSFSRWVFGNEEHASGLRPLPKNECRAG